MTCQSNLVVEREEEGFCVATLPSLPGYHTQARSLDQLMERMCEAIDLYLEMESEPAPSSHRQSTARHAAIFGV